MMLPTSPAAVARRRLHLERLALLLGLVVAFAVVLLAHYAAQTGNLLLALAIAVPLTAIWALVRRHQNTHQ